MKYWDARRIRRVKEIRNKREERKIQQESAARERAHTYTAGDDHKNSELMLEALGSKIRRRMIKRLAREGVMSLSKLAEPLRLKLAAAQLQLHILERAGIVTTHKRGRTRMCVYNPASLRELARWITSGGIRL